MKNQVKLQNFNAFNLYVIINYSILLKTEIKLFFETCGKLSKLSRGREEKKRKELTKSQITQQKLQNMLGIA